MSFSKLRQERHGTDKAAALTAPTIRPRNMALLTELKIDRVAAVAIHMALLAELDRSAPSRNACKEQRPRARSAKHMPAAVAAI